MREIYEMENPNPHLFEDIVEIRKLMAADESEVLKRMEFDADFRAYIKSFLKEIRTNKLYTWYKRKSMQIVFAIPVFQHNILVKNSDVHKGLLSGLKMPSMPKNGFKNFKKIDKTGYKKDKEVKTPSFQGNFEEI